MNAELQAIGYGIAAFVFAVLAFLLVTSYRGRAQGGILLIATIISTIWGAGLAYESVSPELSATRIFALELSFDAAWLLFLAALLSGGVSTAQGWLIRFGGVILALALLGAGIGLEFIDRLTDEGGGAAGILVSGSLLTSLFGLIGIEQIYRNARVQQLKGLKYLCLGLGGIFAYDLFLYSNAILVGEVSDVAWGARGFVVAMCVPLIAVAARRAPSWSVGIFVSRQIVFYSATLFGAGIYLTLVGIVGYYIRVAGEDWGLLAQLLFSSAAFLVLGVFLISVRLRAKLRVFISKHFFENKYDYREEWLRLIDTLTSPDDVMPLKKRSIKALAQIVDAPCGLLWLANENLTQFDSMANWNTPEVESSVSAESSLARYLQRSGWVIERSEYEDDPTRYDSLDLTDVALRLQDCEYIVPLFHEGDLLGFVSLDRSEPAIALNFEDRDLLKTAGKQIASYLAQEIATEKLAENRQFEAFNRLTAYIMHDLKNLIAQQTLVVENAQRHKDKPEFIDDAIETIRGGVARMRRIIENLQQRGQERPAQRIEVGKLVMQAVSQCADRSPVPRAVIGDRQIWVRADRERLQMAMYHAIRNAQDATGVDGQVSIEVLPNGSECAVTVVDDGRGMDEDFIRERLFRPFDSTKGTAGMGIGAYQIRETLNNVGGRVNVDSSPGEGTRLTMVLTIEP